MTELGEGVAILAPKTEKKENVKTGSLKVIVKDVCSGDLIDDAEVMVNGKTQKSNTSGEAIFSNLPVGGVAIRVKKHFNDADYISFIVHYPRVYLSHEAKSSETDRVEIKDGTEQQIEIELVVYKIVGDIVFHRRHISPKGGDKYGHWWTVVNATTSFGWWPKYHLGSHQNWDEDPPSSPTPLSSNAGRMEVIQHIFDTQIYKARMKMFEAKESSPVQTLRGVKGELNGQTSFGGSETRDPHHIGGDSGDEQYRPVRNDCFNPSTIETSISRFASSYATSYSDEWSWRFEGGNHCHTFQKELMKHCNLLKVKLVK